MKKPLTRFAVLLATSAVLTTGAFAQGLVNFFNAGGPLISWYPNLPPLSYPIPGPAGGFYFALLTAPMGTTDSTQFTFSGLYGTNLATAGFVFGGNGRVVTGWVPGTSREFEVVGWSADGGPTYNPMWLTQPWTRGDYWGISMIGSGMAGGTDPTTGGPIPALNIFGAAPSIYQGFILNWIPEPSSATLAALGAACFAFFRRRRFGS